MSDISSSLADGVMALRFDRADKKNAITDAMYDALRMALESAEANPDVRVVLIGSTSEVFTSGRDIGEFAAGHAAARAGQSPPDVLNTPPARFVRALADFPKPIVAAVNGLAVGFGTTMLLHCDLVFVARDARLTAPFVGLGLSPEAGSTLLMPRIAGHQTAFAMFALGTAISGEEAVRLGLAYEATDSSETNAAAQGAAERLAALPPAALQITKRLLRGDPELKAAMDQEAHIFAERIASAEAGEAFSAFGEKRAPDFSKF